MSKVSSSYSAENSFISNVRLCYIYRYICLVGHWTVQLVSLITLSVLTGVYVYKEVEISLLTSAFRISDLCCAIHG